MAAKVFTVTLESQLEMEFKHIKKHEGIQANADMFRHLIKKHFREVKTLDCIGIIPKKDMVILLENALFDIGEQYHGQVTEITIREYLENRFYYWSNTSIEIGIKHVLCLKNKIQN